ncbi:MAG: Ku protein [Firmicutes bacterium]|nr:Ku protein [Bacillota bacterium]
MRSLWNGSISFGLVNIPIKLYTAASNSDIKFNYLHSVCHTPIKYRKTCPNCDIEVDDSEIVKGYEFQRGKYVIMENAELEAIAPEKSRSIDILDFVRLKDIDPVYFNRTYYLQPADTGAKAYFLLKQAMVEKEQIAIAKIVIRSKENLAAIRVYKRGLALETMFYPAEIRAINALFDSEEEPVANERELNMAMALIDNLTTKFQPDQYINEYQNLLMQTIEKKVAGEHVVPAAAPAPAGKIIDLMAALEASVEATGAGSKGSLKRATKAKAEEIS